MDDIYRNPGPLQFDGPGADAKVVTLCVEDQDYMGRIKKLQEYLDKVLTILWSLSQVFFVHAMNFTMKREKTRTIIQTSRSSNLSLSVDVSDNWDVQAWL